MTSQEPSFAVLLLTQRASTIARTLSTRSTDIRFPKPVTHDSWTVGALCAFQDLSYARLDYMERLLADAPKALQHELYDAFGLPLERNLNIYALSESIGCHPELTRLHALYRKAKSAWQFNPSTGEFERPSQQQNVA